MKTFLLLFAGILLTILLSFFCFENKVSDIKAMILQNVTTNLNTNHMQWVKPELLGEGLKSTEIIILKGEAPTIQKKQEAVKIVKNTPGVWGVVDKMILKPKIKKTVIKNEPIIQPKIVEVVKKEEPKVQSVNVCETQLNQVLQDSKINFEVAKSIIKKDSYPLLKSVADVLKKCSNYKVEIAGYTDNQGKEKSNLILSTQRADAVKDFLVLHYDIDPQTLISRGYGDANPIASNDTKEGRAKNRRIEFHILGDE